MIVNCTGLGAKDLLPDPDLRPIRGQHVVFTNPGLTEFFSEDTGLSPDLLCFYPHGDTVVLGGTAIDGEGGLASDDTAAASILARCTEVEPVSPQPAFWSIRSVPGPPGLRSGWALTGRRTAPWVVHNYGHGGAGVTLSWGCAGEAYELLASE